ncbi:MAG: response regulator of citrate/malate metabolism [Sphingobacteriales bacterium]|jgi:response regulator of citrate/malate metabolism
MEKYEVMLDDDDPLSTFITRRLVDSQGFDIEIKDFFKSRDAVRFLTGSAQEELPDLVLLDINRPIFNGWKFLESIHSHYIAVDVEMLSSSLDLEELEKAMNYPSVVDYMTKPFSIKNGRDLLNHLQKTEGKLKVG